MRDRQSRFLGPIHGSLQLTLARQREEVCWPACKNPFEQHPEWSSRVEAQVLERLSRLSLEDKVAQMIQAESSSITPQEAGRYGIGSILNGGGIFPNANKHASAAEWADQAQAFREATDNFSSHGIPILWGTDAVHGHSNVFGATIFPHNIGLGAARDPDLVERIAEATAKEVYATGIDWTFAPTLAVVRDARWGRSYEGYSEDPDIVERYAERAIRGLQGSPCRTNFISDGRILATCKHFVGEGGTEAGRDQGDTVCSEHELLHIHAPGHLSGIQAGALVVMAAFNSWCGSKVHGNSYLLNRVLKRQMGFRGFVVSDWDAFLQLHDDPATSCETAVNAGVDMLMVSSDWQRVLDFLIDAVHKERISKLRIDDAVTRILRVKEFAGLMDRPKPTNRLLSSGDQVLGCRQHRDLAREAVRKSLVLLKNEGNLLPLKRYARIAIAGDGAANVPKQCGGWSLTWQGHENTNKDFPQGESVFSAIENIAREAGGSVRLIDSLQDSDDFDVGIVVFGEDPYAEGDGDLNHLSFSKEFPEPLQTMRTFQSRGIPVVAVFVTGRPRWTNPELNASDAFVVAWLPGTEGGGIADVLFRGPDGSIQHDFQGRLSFSWPRTLSQTGVNRGESEFDPLFPYGFGLTYKDADPKLETLDETDTTTGPVRVKQERSTIYSHL